jgi:alpha-L-fucosidase
MAYNNHLKRYGHPTDSGYKEVLRDWNPEKLSPAWYVKLYHDIGAALC